MVLQWHHWKRVQPQLKPHDISVSYMTSKPKQLLIIHKQLPLKMKVVCKGSILSSTCTCCFYTCIPKRETIEVWAHDKLANSSYKHNHIHLEDKHKYISITSLKRTSTLPVFRNICIKPSLTVTLPLPLSWLPCTFLLTFLLPSEKPVHN